MKGWIAAVFVGLLGALGLYRERSKRIGQSLKSSEAQADNLTRQIETGRQQDLEAQKEINEARTKNFTVDDINSVLRKQSNSRTRH